MIICTDCKHGGRYKYCQSPHCISLSNEKKRTVYLSCAFFEIAKEELRDEEKRRDEPELF